MTHTEESSADAEDRRANSEDGVRIASSRSSQRFVQLFTRDPSESRASLRRFILAALSIPARRPVQSRVDASARLDSLRQSLPDAATDARPVVEWTAVSVSDEEVASNLRSAAMLALSPREGKELRDIAFFEDWKARR